MKRLEITYPGELWPKMDELLESTFHKESVGSGMSLGRHPQRDITFEFPNLRNAEEAEKKVKKICPSAATEIR